MSEPSTQCIVCQLPLPTGYRGRPRVVCSDACYNVRRPIRAHNQEALSIAQAQLLRVVQSLTAWPELQIEALALFSALRGTGDEVTDANLERPEAPPNLADLESLIK